MERCDFSSIITIIRRYISDAKNVNQIDLLYELFASFINDANSQDFDFDNGLVCRWVNGISKISPRISCFYMEKKNIKMLEKDIQMRVIPLMYDSVMAIQEIYDVLIYDSTISDKVKKELLRSYPCKNQAREAGFLTSVIKFGMEREFVKRDAYTKNLLAAGNLSPMLRNFIMEGEVPKPCRYFCGRDSELSVLHDMLTQNSKVFLHGIAGIGKSELAKAYAMKHKKEYTNILHLTYTGDLRKDISNMDFADDIQDEGEEERFRKHNRFLRTLKEDTLIILNYSRNSIDDKNCAMNL